MQIAVFTLNLCTLKCRGGSLHVFPRTNSQIVPCLFLEWRDRPSCHLMSLDWLASLPVALAPHTKPALISEPRGVLALEF